jgi:hypothetical protein
MLTFRDAEYRRLFDYLKNFGFENETEVVMPGTNAQMQFGIGPKFLLSSRAPASCGFIAEAAGTVVQLALLRRNLDFRTQCKASIVAMAISGISAVWMAWRGYGVWSLAAQALIYTTASTGLIWGVLYVRAQQNMRSTSGIDEPAVSCAITGVRPPFEGIHSASHSERKTMQWTEKLFDTRRPVERRH